MKALKLLVLMVAVGALFTFSSCGGGGTTPEPITDQQLTKLSKTWKLTAVTLTDGLGTNSMAPNIDCSVMFGLCQEKEVGRWGQNVPVTLVATLARVV